MEERAWAEGGTMSGPAKSILGRLSRFHTRDADEARAFLSTKDYELDLSRSDARQIDLRINGVYLRGAYVGYYQYGAPIVARTHASRHHYLINLPLGDAVQAAIGAETPVCGSQQRFLSSPKLQYLLPTEGGSCRRHWQSTG